MANTYTLIASSTVGAGGAANIAFSSIPSTYTDLKMVVSNRGASNGGGTGGAWDNFTITFNGSSSNLSSRWITGVDSSTGSGNSSASIFTWADYNGATANTFSSVEFYIPNYASSNNKSISTETVTENSGTSGLLGLTAGLWSNASAITSITITPNVGNWAQYSTAYLYGIKNS